MKIAIASLFVLVLSLQTYSMPVAYTKNVGQWNEKVLYRTSTDGATIWIAKDGIYFQYFRRVAKSESEDQVNADLGAKLSDRLGSLRDCIETMVIKATFVGANGNPNILGENLMEYKCNYFLGNDPSAWHMDVPNYRAVTLKDIYPGIDLRFAGAAAGRASYEFIAANFADITQVKVKFDWEEETSIDAAGRAVLKTKWGGIAAPMASPTNGALSGAISFYEFVGKKSGVDALGMSQQVTSNLAVGLNYSTYLGGTGNDEIGTAIAVDSSGSAYVTGWTNSSDFPIMDPIQTYQVDIDGFVTKLSPSGESLIFSTYFGGGGDDKANAIDVSDSDNAYITGWTSSTNYPTQNPFQPTFQGVIDVFLTKLSGTGNRLIYSTYLGGEGEDVGSAIAVDSGENAYVTGWVSSSDFPILNPFQTFQGYFDGFVSKFSASGESLMYSTYLGGGAEDYFKAIAVDSSFYAYVTGGSSSSDYPTQNSIQSTRLGYSDVVVTKLSNTGDHLIYSTYLGGKGDEHGSAVAVDGNGCAFVTGSTWSIDFPTFSPYQATLQGGWDAFVTKLSSAGNTPIWSTYLGGGGDDEGFGIAIDTSGHAYLTGLSNSPNFPTQSPFQVTLMGLYDVFVTILSKLGNDLIFSTYLGGEGDEWGEAVAVDIGGNAYVVGGTTSSDFPTEGPYQTLQGTKDVFVTKLFSPALVCGDADGSGMITISDVVYLIYYIFASGLAPDPMCSGDANGTGSINISDAVYIINFIFGGGPAPFCP